MGSLVPVFPRRSHWLFLATCSQGALRQKPDQENQHPKISLQGTYSGDLWHRRDFSALGGREETDWFHPGLALFRQAVKWEEQWEGLAGNEPSLWKGPCYPRGQRCERAAEQAVLMKGICLLAERLGYCFSIWQKAVNSSLHSRGIKRPWNSPMQMVRKTVLMARTETRKTQGFCQEQLLSSAGAEKHKARVGISQPRDGGRVTQVLYTSITCCYLCSKDWGTPQVL